jgi:S-DNA-T family DNA segregation ATPase FtsK/SpoIIIE
MTGLTAPEAVIPAGPVLSMFNPVHIGVDEFGAPVHTKVIYKNLLAAGEPGSGKSGLMNILTAHAALSARSRLVLFDGKQVELGFWDHVADEFVGPDLDHAIITLKRLQRVMDNRYSWLRARQRRKIEPGDDITVITSVFDEIALFSTVLGTEQQQREFVTLLRDLVARGRAAAMPVIAATQRPSIDIIPKSLRDLFGYRAAFCCTSIGSSDIILGDGWDSRGYSAADLSPTNPGLTYLITEGGSPAWSRSPTSPTTTSSPWPPTPQDSAARRPDPPPPKGTRHARHRPANPQGLHHGLARAGRLPHRQPRHSGPLVRHHRQRASRQRRPRRVRASRPHRRPARRPG